MTMSINEAKARFYVLPIAKQCRYWNVFATIKKQDDGDDIFLFSNDGVEDRIESINEIAVQYEIEPYDMYQMGAINGEVYDIIGRKYMFYDEENHDIHVVSTIEECFEEETIEAFFDLFAHTLDKWESTKHFRQAAFGPEYKDEL